MDLYGSVVEGQTMLDGVRRLVPARLRRSYVAKFGLVIALIALTVGLVGAGATTVIADEIGSGVETEYATTANEQSNSVAEWIDNSRMSARLVADTSEVRSDDPSEVREHITDRSQRINSQRTELLNIHVVDDDTGDVFASTSASAAGETFTDDDVPWLDDRDLDGSHRVHLSEVYQDDDEYVVAFVREIPETNRILAVEYDIQQQGGILIENFRSNHVTIVVDGDDRVVMSDEFDRTNLETFDEPELLENARALSDDQRAFEERDGVDTIHDRASVVAYSPVEGSDWVLFNVDTQSSAFGVVTTIQTYGGIATAFGVLFVGILGAVLGRNTARSIDRLTAKAAQMEDGDLDVDFDTERIDNIGRLYQGFAEMRDALREQIDEAQQARQAAEAERERIQQMNETLEDAAAEYSAVMGSAADGDFTVRADADVDHDQMRQIGQDFNEMLAEIEATTEHVKGFARRVATASEEVTASSEEVRSASQQVTESIQEISDGADRQNDSLQAVSSEMAGLSTTTQQIAASSNQVADVAERTADTGAEGQQAAEAAIAGMNEIERESEAAVDAIEALENEVAQIDELIEFIRDVAEQTNMLALNANIEASRSAGGDSEGFGVVANEVKELSAETKEAAEDIENRLEEIQTQTERTAREVQLTSEEVAKHKDSVEAAVDALDDIADYAQETNTGVQEISAATEQQAAATQEVVAMVDEAATISEETTAEAENVAAAAEEQTTALTEVTTSASDLSEQAARLSEALDRFDTDADVGAGEGESRTGDGDADTGGDDTTTGADAVDSGTADPGPSDGDGEPATTDADGESTAEQPTADDGDGFELPDDTAERTD